jgi:hypothetical protein
MSKLQMKKRQILVENYLPHNFWQKKNYIKLFINKFKRLNLLHELFQLGFYFKNHQEIYKAIILCMKINYQ